MKRIYLDQNIWIALSRARIGSNSESPHWDDAYQLAKAAVAQGLASFVLSQTHIYETQKRQLWDQRLDVVETMIELSRLHAIAHVTTVVPEEANAAIGHMAELEYVPMSFFGVGVEAMLTKHVVIDNAPSSIDLASLGLRPSFLHMVDTNANNLVWDALLLLGPHPGVVDPRTRAALQSVDNAFAADQSEVAARFKALTLSGPSLEEVLTQYTLLEVRHEIFRAASERGVPREAVVDLMIAHPGEWLRALPSRDVAHSMYM